VIFLGDLMDEGSIATPDEYERYVKRFHWTFPETVKHIYLPGDNDIGGEGDPITYQKINSYIKHFGQPEVMKVKGVTFYKVGPFLFTDGADDNFKIFSDKPNTLQVSKVETLTARE
jgi:ethanolamine phosphate phosphodiesterase